MTGSLNSYSRVGRCWQSDYTDLQVLKLFRRFGRAWPQRTELANLQSASSSPSARITVLAAVVVAAFTGWPGVEQRRGERSGGAERRGGQEVKVVTTNAPGLALADFLTVAPVAFGGLRLLRGAYGGPLIRVRRASDNAVAEIYPTSTGALDVAAIAAHCTTSDGTIQVWYDQGGIGIGGTRNATTASTSREYKIWDGTSQTIASNPTTGGRTARPAAFVGTIEDKGYSLNIPAITGAKLSALVVAAHSNSTVSSANGARFMSVMHSSNADSNATTRALLIGRQGGGTPTVNWGTLRNSSYLATAAGVYGQLDEIGTVYDGTNAKLYRNGSLVQQAASTAAFNVTRLGLGYTGISFVSCPNAYESEWWLWDTNLGAADLDELHADHAAYFGIS